MIISRLALIDTAGGLPRIAGAVIRGSDIYLSGITGDPRGDVREQTSTALKRIDALLARAGSDKSHILSAQVWLADMADFAAHNQAWNEWVDHASPPARACVQATLWRPEFRVEIMLTACRRQYIEE